MKRILAVLTVFGGLFLLPIGGSPSAQAGVNVYIGPSGFHIGVHKKRYHKKRYYKRRYYKSRHYKHRRYKNRYYRPYIGYYPKRHRHYPKRYHRYHVDDRQEYNYPQINSRR
ncbi:hypothetical protein [Coralliovum pocilloporae]|uniref:hypothetical protein n=1 Tax=Coralliovum pocilloporae TaxID=3066369 RepID=UPI003307BA48